MRIHKKALFRLFSEESSMTDPVKNQHLALISAKVLNTCFDCDNSNYVDINTVDNVLDEFTPEYFKDLQPLIGDLKMKLEQEAR